MGIEHLENIKKIMYKIIAFQIQILNLDLCNFKNMIYTGIRIIQAFMVSIKIALNAALHWVIVV